MSVDCKSPDFEARSRLTAPTAAIPNGAEPARSMSLATCSVCLSVLRSGEWIEAEAVIRELRSFEQMRPPRLDPALCATCAETIHRRRAHVPKALAGMGAQEMTP